MTSSAAELIDVAKVYQIGGEPVKALDGVNLKIAAGDYVAVMGPSGSGKSTLLNVLGGIDRPSSGMVKVCGDRIDNQPERRLLGLRRHKVAFVFQEARLLLSHTAIENVMLPSAFSLGGSEVRQRAQTLLERVGLGERANHMVHQLSGGEAQRVCIARALLARPALILADEPTGNLDHRTRLQIVELLETVRDEGCAVVLVTHDPEVAARAQRRMHLQDGRIAEAA